MRMSSSEWVAPGAYEVASGVYRIPLPLPNDGLRAVNVYVIESDHGLAVIDAGWDLLAFAQGARFVIETNAMLTLDADPAARSGLTAGTEWLVVTGYRRVDDHSAPICRTEYFINRSFAAVGRLLQHHTGPIFPLIEDLFGVTEVGTTVAIVDSPPLTGGSTQFVYPEGAPPAQSQGVTRAPSSVRTPLRPPATRAARAVRALRPQPPA